MKQYNLTFWQRLFLIPLKVYWYLSVNDDKKTWHEVKKGMEHHTHKYTIPKRIQGFRVLACEHEGCNMVDPVEDF